MDTTIQSLWRLKPMTQPQSRRGDLVSTTKIGVEVEVENVRAAPDIPGWNLTHDGSLRNGGVEYVFSSPIGGSSACTRLSNLEQVLNTVSRKTFGPRTSVHVHVDVRDLTWKQACKMIMLYAMVEPYLFSICGQDRDENIYSLSLYRGQDQVTRLNNLIQNGPEYLNDSQWAKYSSINLLAMRTFGSLEFRGHKGTCDKGVLVNWINHLLSLKMYVLDESKDITDLPMILSQNGHIALLAEIFGQKLVVANIKRANRVRSLIYEGVWVAEDIIYHTNFKEIEVKLIKSLSKNNLNQMKKLRNKLCVD
jgi:hypothetical protein